MKESMGPGFGRPKTEHELQSQIEDFAEEKFVPKFVVSDNNTYYENNKISRPIFKNSKELASITNLDTLPEDISGESKELVVKHKDAYLAFLKAQSSDKLKFQTECIERYDQEFKRIVEHLRSQLSNVKTGEDFEVIDPGMRSGFEAFVFKIQTHSGVYAAKLFHVEDISEQQLDAMRRAKDIPNVSHLVAYSRKEKAIIMDFFEGENLGLLKKAERPTVTTEELRSILGTFVNLYTMDIRLDTSEVKGGNIMFNKEKGFFFIDYSSMSKPYSIVTAVQRLSRALTLRADFRYGREYDSEVSDTNRRMIEGLRKDFPEFYNKHKNEFEKGAFELLKANIKRFFK